MANSTFHATLGKTEDSKIHSITLGGEQVATVCPPPMLRENPCATSPHHLFLGSIGACVNLVFEIALEKARIQMIDLNSAITGDYETDDETGASRFTAISIDTVVTVPEGTNEKRLQKLFDVAHKNCPIGNCLVGSCVKLLTNLTVQYR